MLTIFSLVVFVWISATPIVQHLNRVLVTVRREGGREGGRETVREGGQKEGGGGVLTLLFSRSPL